MKELFIRYSKIENTRMIFDFMQKLDERCSDDSDLIYTGQGLFEQREEIISRLTEEIDEQLKQSKDWPENGEYLFQNPISQYIRFWDEMYADKKIDLQDKHKNIQDILANMLNYFRIIKRLEELSEYNIKNDDLPYIYEDICLSINKITGNDMCYILCGEANDNIQMITRSGYRLEGLDEKTVDIRIDKLIEGINKEENEKIKGVYFLDEDKETNIVISIPENYSTNKKGRTFYIVLQKLEKIKYSDDIMKMISMFMFLRDRFLNVLKRDFAVLLNFRFDVSYIKSVQNPIEKINVLHISDLHITENKKWEINSLTVNKIIKEIKSKKAFEKVDLIAITGDIIQGANNANGAQERYKKAGDIIRKIAAEIWGLRIYKGGDMSWILPHDWKRRILITTGNHDYAAMNDVIVQTQSRVIKSASPSKNKGGTMSKFTYLIEFMQYFLDAPIDKLINNDLNEVRNYKNLNLNVFVLNSASLANSLQNNKVGFNKEKVETLIQTFIRTNEDKYHCMCLVHHSPMYKIDYVRDIYTPYNLFDISFNSLINELYNCFNNVIGKIKSPALFEPCNTIIIEFKRKFEKFSDVIEKYQMSNGCTSKNCLEDIVKESLRVSKASERDINFWVRRFCESDLYADMRALYRYINNREEDEFSLSLFNKLRNIYQTNHLDQKEFKEVFNRILERDECCVKVVLAGHEHRRSDRKLITKKKIPVYIEGTIEKGSSIICIDKAGKAKRELK